MGNIAGTTIIAATRPSSIFKKLPHGWSTYPKTHRRLRRRGSGRSPERGWYDLPTPIAKKFGHGIITRAGTPSYGLTASSSGTNTMMNTGDVEEPLSIK